MRCPYFQSHFGLISTLLWAAVLATLCFFQSHFGLISTWVKDGGGHAFSKNFQSHFGLISTGVVLINGGVRIDFQSHFGLISTKRRWNLERSIQKSFNPTLVLFQPRFKKLYKINTSLSIPLWSYFNKAGLVSRKVGLGLSIPLWSYFNVRLEMLAYESELTFNPTLVLFQRNSTCKNQNKWKRILSIPLWSYFNLKINFALLTNLNFQSHFGLISTFFNSSFWAAASFAFNPTLVLFQLRRAGEYSRQIFLSIPLWSYFNAAIELARAKEDIFQSHFGLISTQRWRIHKALQRCFQSHFGLISTCFYSEYLSRYGSFQSHFGLISTKSIS